MLEWRGHSRLLIPLCVTSSALLILLYYVAYGGSRDPVTITQIFTPEQLHVVALRKHEKNEDAGAGKDEHLPVSAAAAKNLSKLLAAPDGWGPSYIPSGELSETEVLIDYGEETKNVGLNESLAPLGAEIDPVSTVPMTTFKI